MKRTWCKWKTSIQKALVENLKAPIYIFRIKFILTSSRPVPLLSDTAVRGWVCILHRDQQWGQTISA